MAKKKCFIIKDNKVIEKLIEFKYYNGFSISQKQKSIAEQSNAIKKEFGLNSLEISSKSNNLLGRRLSAFNLTISIGEKKYYLESLFQASKVFENGGPYTDLIHKMPIDAKKDERLRNSGGLLYFEIGNNKYDINPKTSFYDWLYCNAVLENKELLNEVSNFKCFTDIEFNYQKSINCQARSLAILVVLFSTNKLNIIKDYNEFKEYVYNNIVINESN